MSPQNQTQTHLTGKTLAGLLNTAGFLGTLPITAVDLENADDTSRIRTKRAKQNGVRGQKYERSGSEEVLGALGEEVIQQALRRMKGFKPGALIAVCAVKDSDFKFDDLDYDIKGLAHDKNELRVNHDHHASLGHKFDYYLYFKPSACGTFASLYNIPTHYISTWPLKKVYSKFYAKNLTKMLAHIAYDASPEAIFDYPLDHDFSADATYLDQQAAVD